MVALVARSKLVPDFALTVHFLHLVIATLYTGRLPRHAMWWFTMLASAALSVGLGIWGCRYRELQPVFFGGRRILAATGPESAATPAATTTTTGEATVTEQPRDEEEMAVPGGRSGEYEMEPMRPVR